MRFYNLTTKLHALSNLKNKRLKVSRLNELNDPFELLGIEMPDKEIRKAFQHTRKQLHNSHGLICFSKYWSNPVLWSHYGQKHYGICLGFEVPGETLEKVNYVNSMLSYNPSSWETDAQSAELKMRELLHQKYIDWKYEKEYRGWVDLDEKDEDTGHYFIEFSKSLILKEVIIGARCDCNSNDIANILKDYNYNVKIIKARLAFNSYSIVQNLKYKIINTNS